VANVGGPIFHDRRLRYATLKRDRFCSVEYDFEVHVGEGVCVCVCVYIYIYSFIRAIYIYINMSVLTVCLTSMKSPFLCFEGKIVCREFVVIFIVDL
jgi:hypothetical protein